MISMPYVNIKDGDFETSDGIEEDDEERQEIARSSYAGMLHDSERHRKYFDALKETIDELFAEGRDEILTLDVGAGTGILSMMAAKSGSSNVIACEMFEPSSKLARDIIGNNGLNKIIKVINKASSELEIPKDLPRRADVLVTEIFDSELLGEGVLPILRDVHRRLTSPRTKTIPSSSHINVQLIQSDSLWEMNKLCTSDGDVIGDMIPPVFMNCPGTANTHELQVSHLYPKKIHLLSDSVRITCFDFTQPFTITEKISERETKICVTSAGIIHGIVLWWDLVLHEEKNIVLSMEPSWLIQKRKSHNVGKDMTHDGESNNIRTNESKNCKDFNDRHFDNKSSVNNDDGNKNSNASTCHYVKSRTDEKICSNSNSKSIKDLNDDGKITGKPIKNGNQTTKKTSSKQDNNNKNNYNKDDYVWREHWMQCVYYVKSPICVKEGDEINVVMYFDDYSIWFDIGKSNGDKGENSNKEYSQGDEIKIKYDEDKSSMRMTYHQGKQRPLCECGLHIAWPKERFALWNNGAFLKMWHSFLVNKQYQRSKNDSPDILVLGEMSLLPFIIERYTKRNILYLELSEWSGNPALQRIKSHSGSNVHFISNSSSGTESGKILDNGHFDYVFVDPISSSSILPWHHLKMWYQLHSLRQKFTKLSKIKSYPVTAHLKACIVNLSHLWKVRAPVHSVEGFSLEQFDLLMSEVQSSFYIEPHGNFQNAAPYSMMEYENEVISDIIHISSFHYNESPPSQCVFFDCKICCYKAISEMSSLVFWLEFEVDNERDNEQPFLFSLGLDNNRNWVTYSRQGILFLPEEITSRGAEKVECRVMFEPSTCEMIFSMK